MYNFIDINEIPETSPLPSEALQINGEYIENLIDGYRTLQVSGREALSKELSSFSTGVRDGETLKSRRYPARTILVKYQLISESNEAFRSAYNKLAQILDVENAELIFNDETDKFFIGTPSVVGEVDPGTNAVVGEFELYCADPFKYSVVEHEAEPNAKDGSFLIDYNGTYKAYPTLEAEFYKEEGSGALTGDGDCGYVAFFNENEKIIQLGDPDETDTEKYPKSQTLVYQKFNTETSWGTIEETNWRANDGQLPYDAEYEGVTDPDKLDQTGNVTETISAYSTTPTPSTSGRLLEVTSRAESPYIKYTVNAQTSKRTADSIRVSVTIMSVLTSKTAYLRGERELKASVQFENGDWHSVAIKSKKTDWKGNVSYVTSISVTVNDLTADQKLLKNIKFKVERTDDLGESGVLDETHCNDLEIGTYTAPVPSGWYLMPETYGTGTVWHGPSITRTIPADASGDVGSSQYTFTYSQKMSIGNSDSSISPQELGIFQAALVNVGVLNKRTVVAGVSIKKMATGKNAQLLLYVNGKVVYMKVIDLSFHNQYFGNNSSSKGITTVKTSSITRSGSNVIFNIGGIKKTIYAPLLPVVHEITFYMGQYAKKPALSYNGLYWAKFVNNRCDTWEDIPNKFSANDIVTADCKSGEIFLNDSPMPALGALGNDWEEFYLSPGLNQIGYSYSSWVKDEHAPNCKIRYREVFI